MPAGLNVKHQDDPNMYVTLTKYEECEDLFGGIIQADVHTIHENDKDFKDLMMNKM